MTKMEMVWAQNTIYMIEKSPHFTPEMRQRCIQELRALTASRSGETGWQPIETAPLNKTVDLWCIEQDSPATWGSGRPAGQIVRGRHKSEKYGWFGNQGNDGVPRHDGLDLVPVAWIEPTPDIPLAMVEQFLAAAPLPTQEPKPGGEPEDDGQPDEQQEWHDFDPDC